MFDHEIPLNQESRITIVHGPNGVGKTVLFQLVHALFHYDYELLRHLPYQELSIELDQDRRITIGKSYITGLADFVFEYADNTDTRYEWFEPCKRKNNEVDKAVRDYFPDFERVEWRGRSYWIKPSSKKEGGFVLDVTGGKKYDDFGKVYSLKELFDNNPDFHSEVYGKTPEWIQIIYREVETAFIDSQRLLGVPLVLLCQEPYDFELSNFESVVEAVSFKLLNSSYMHEDFFEDLRTLKELNILAIKEARLLGELSDEYKVHEHLAEERQVLHSLRQTFTNKYEDFEPLQRALMYLDTINGYFLFKSCILQDQDEGLQLLAQNGKEVPLTGLSSGEQHLLVLYYRLLFEVQPNTLVMIDEPELSMNVVWQRNFLNDLQRIIELCKFDVLIATHSPMIIHDKWDWVVHLGDKVDD